MNKFLLAAGLATLLSSTAALADYESFTFQECRLMSGGLGWVKATYALYSEPQPHGSRVSLSVENMNSPCTPADYEQSRGIAANWSENWPALPASAAAAAPLHRSRFQPSI